MKVSEEVKGFIKDLLKEQSPIMKMAMEELRLTDPEEYAKLKTEMDRMKVSL